ncbi:hypothetical protein [Pseudomonas sp. PNPG3]|uniref:hypothetical protein n=1 Tax=Pseudomonas sp. PNPG3 TaxID=2919497 RepID=UPI001FFD2C50|nr:hypothetical protein [Pseudomonas sp. PNPG3]MCK2122089.1 hypothetical protein [Pseudomonas sp. PNPG3]
MSNQTKHNLDTSVGGRGYVADLFKERLGTHSYDRYINGTLAADFACALSGWLAPVLAKVDHFEQTHATPAEQLQAALYEAQQERDALQARSDALTEALEEVLVNAERGLPDPLHRKLRQLLPPPAPAPANEAERPGFEEWHRDRFKTKFSTGAPTRDMHGSVWAAVYGPPNQQQMWESWQARAALGAAENAELRTKLAGRDALLRDCFTAMLKGGYSKPLRERIKGALSASSEPEVKS